jgi:hypothetical protein
MRITTRNIMERITVKDSRMESLVALYDLHTEYFKRAIVDISTDDAHNRLNTKANHVAWLTGSLVQERFEFAKIFGSNLKQAADDLFKDYQGIKDDVRYPSLEDFRKDWDKITPVLRDIMLGVSTEKLDSILEFPNMPEMNMPHYEFFKFMIYREANCIGQIALWRRLLGYPALKYD